MWLTSPGLIVDELSTALTVAATPRCHSIGSCSDHPLDGCFIEHGKDDVATVPPSGEHSTALTLCDPTSTPIT